MSYTMENSLVRMRARVADRLARDLERIRLGTGPTAEEIAAAPVIEEWTITPIVATGLHGRVVGIPGFVSTSELFVLDAAAGYCRTFSRFYRLGQGGL